MLCWKKIINKCKRCWRNLESIIIVIQSIHERHRAHVGTNDNLQAATTIYKSFIIPVCSKNNSIVFVVVACCSLCLLAVARSSFLPCCSFVFTVAVALSLLLLLLCLYCCCCFVDRQQNCFIAVGCMFSISPNKWSLCNNLWINKCSVEKLSNFFFCLFIYNHLHNNLQGMLLINV